MELDANKLEGGLAFDGGRGVGYHDERKGDWMQTYSGGRFYPADPRKEDLDMPSMVMSLCTKNRYNGHCLPYNVAEHSILISKLVKPRAKSIAKWGADALRMVQKFALVHDNVESIITDMVRPIKRVLGKENDYFKIERNVEATAIFPFFGLDIADLPEEVIELDTAICVLERRVLHARASEWHLPFAEPQATILGLEWFEAGEAWLRRYCELWEVDFESVWQPWFRLVSADMERLRAHIEAHDETRAIAVENSVLLGAAAMRVAR